jgi:hypothetical protein
MSASGDTSGGTSGNASSARAEELARQFEQVNDEVIAFVEACDDAAWKATCADDERTVGAVAQHIADGHRGVTQWVSTLAAGQPVTVTMDQIHSANAQAAAIYGGRSQSEVADSLRRRGAAAAARVRGLSDEDLARSAPFGPGGGMPLSAEMIIVRAMLGHPRGHLESMRKSTAGSA